MAFTREQYIRYYADFRFKCFQILGWECAICGSEKDLEIDHIKWQDKSFDISKRYAPKWWPMIVEELKKCQTLCWNCHRKKTNSELAERFPERKCSR